VRSEGVEESGVGGHQFTCLALRKGETEAIVQGGPETRGDLSGPVQQRRRGMQDGKVGDDGVIENAGVAAADADPGVAEPWEAVLARLSRKP